MNSMCYPKLKELPAPPPGKFGWPWTEQSRRLPNTMPNGRPWPRITVVTPSFNQGQFIEETIRSVLLQGYPNLEYFIFDAGSTDNSVEIIKKYDAWLRFWVSEPDAGQSAAINRGLQMGSGLYATWINSDDMMYKNALIEHACRIGFDGNRVYVGLCFYIDVAGKTVVVRRGRIHSLEDLLSIKTIWRSGGNIVQPEVLFPLRLALQVGGLNPDNHFTMDYELWGKFFLAGARFQYTEIPFGMARLHSEQKTANGLRQTRALVETAVGLIAIAPGFSEETRNKLLTDINAFWDLYWRDSWPNSGRLAKIGLPPSIVNPLRKLKARFERAISK